MLVEVVALETRRVPLVPLVMHSSLVLVGELKS